MNTDELLSYAIRHFGKNSINEVKDNPNLVAFSSPITKNWFALLNLDPRNKSLNINCGDFAATIKDLPGFSASSLIKEAKWVEVSLGLSNQKIKKVNIIDIFEKANTLFLEEQKELILSNVSERSWYTPLAVCSKEKIKRIRKVIRRKSIRKKD